MSIEEIMQQAVERARAAGCHVVGGRGADHYKIQTPDGEWIVNPDTGAGSEPGFAFITAWDYPQKRALWTIHEDQVADWGDGVEQLAAKIVRLCSVLDGVPPA